MVAIAAAEIADRRGPSSKGSADTDQAVLDSSGSCQSRSGLSDCDDSDASKGKSRTQSFEKDQGKFARPWAMM